MFLSLPVIVSVVIKPSIVPTLLYVSLLHTKDSPLSNNRLARNVVVLLQIISDIIIPLHRDAVGLKIIYNPVINLRFYNNVLIAGDAGAGIIWVVAIVS